MQKHVNAIYLVVCACLLGWLVFCSFVLIKCMVEMELFKSQDRNLEDPVCVLFALLED